MTAEQTDRKRRGGLLVISVLVIGALAVVELVKGGMNDEAGPEDVIGFAVFSAISIGLGAVLLLRTLPMAERAPDGDQRIKRLGVVLGVLAVISLPAYWSGVPFALGVSAILAGRAAGSEFPARTAVVLGALAVLGGVVIAVVG